MRKQAGPASSEIIKDMKIIRVFEKCFCCGKILYNNIWTQNDFVYNSISQNQFRYCQLISINLGRSDSDPYQICFWFCNVSGFGSEFRTHSQPDTNLFQNNSSIKNSEISRTRSGSLNLINVYSYKGKFMHRDVYLQEHLKRI